MIIHLRIRKIKSVKRCGCFIVIAFLMLEIHEWIDDEKWTDGCGPFCGIDLGNTLMEEIMV